MSDPIKLARKSDLELALERIGELEQSITFVEYIAGLFGDDSSPVRVGKFTTNAMVGLSPLPSAILRLRRRGREAWLGGAVTVPYGLMNTGYPFVRLPPEWIPRFPEGNPPASSPRVSGSLYTSAGVHRADVTVDTYMSPGPDDDASGWVAGLSGYLLIPLIGPAGNVVSPVSSDLVAIYPGIGTAWHLPVNPDDL